MTVFGESPWGPSGISTYPRNGEPESASPVGKTPTTRRPVRRYQRSTGGMAGATDRKGDEVRCGAVRCRRPVRGGRGNPRGQTREPGDRGRRPPERSPSPWAAPPAPRPRRTGTMGSEPRRRAGSSRRRAPLHHAETRHLGCRGPRGPPSTAPAARSVATLETEGLSAPVMLESDKVGRRSCVDLSYCREPALCVPGEECTRQDEDRQLDPEPPRHVPERGLGQTFCALQGRNHGEQDADAAQKDAKG